MFRKRVNLAHSGSGPKNGVKTPSWRTDSSENSTKTDDDDDDDGKGDGENDGCGCSTQSSNEASLMALLFGLPLV
jgi:hypothetical protein